MVIELDENQTLTSPLLRDRSLLGNCALRALKGHAWRSGLTTSRPVNLAKSLSAEAIRRIPCSRMSAAV